MNDQLMEELDLIKGMAEEHMQKAVHHLEAELVKVRAGRANASMLEGVKVDYYGTHTPVQQVANISTPDARTIAIQPWEKHMLGEIEKAILAANIGLTPQNNGEMVRLNLPPLTEERRKELVKNVKHLGEGARVTVRNARKEANDHIKKIQKDGLPEDMAKDAEDLVQKMTDQYIAEVDKVLDRKEKEIMTV
ncbi:MAG: ribosome recycling factor [Chitinophagales bacterium]|nr:ribosome recycling factor [Chitinophagales bacterium]HQU39829.1 ribosome recycling factor [Chitinophagales bacterium]HQU76353.1 ribosome recycling factor [Chitinophagales bacterium]HRX24475.1 ribosome recycling factor [Chitinophagales bacterium]